MQQALRGHRGGTRPRPPSGAPGRLAIGGRRGTGGSGDAAPVRGGGGRCRAHVPAAHYKWPGGGRSRSIPRLLGKGSGVHGGGRGTRTFPGARAARGSGRGDGRSALAGSRRRPASAALPSSRGRRLLAPAPCLWAASKSPAGSSSHPEDGGGGLGTRPPGHAPRARRCSRGSEGDFLPRWSRAPGLRRGARSPSPGAPEAAGRASPGPLRPLLQRVRRKDVSPLLGPRGASLATERGPGARFARGLPRTEWLRRERIPGRARGARGAPSVRGSPLCSEGLRVFAAQPGAGGGAERSPHARQLRLETAGSGQPGPVGREGSQVWS